MDQFSELPEADAIYAATLFHADLRIGQLLDALERNGLQEDTLVIFSSDNGPARGAPDTPLKLTYDTATGLGYGLGAAKGITGGRLEYKGSLMEGGIGVPFIARWPGKVPAGVVDKTNIISAVDLLPTFCALADVPLPVDYRPDGISQVPALEGNSTTGRESPLFWRMAKKSRAFAVVHKQWKMVADSELSQFELFDLVADPLESKELSSAQPEVVKELKKLIVEWQKTLPDTPSGPVFSALRAENVLK